jgi:hypothetical protein
MNLGSTENHMPAPADMVEVPRTGAKRGPEVTDHDRHEKEYSTRVTGGAGADRYQVEMVAWPHTRHLKMAMATQARRLTSAAPFNS